MIRWFFKGMLLWNRAKVIQRCFVYTIDMTLKLSTSHIEILRYNTAAWGFVRAEVSMKICWNQKFCSYEKFMALRGIVLAPSFWHFSAEILKAWYYKGEKTWTIKGILSRPAWLPALRSMCGNSCASLMLYLASVDLLFSGNLSGIQISLGFKKGSMIPRMHIVLHSFSIIVH